MTTIAEFKKMLQQEINEPLDYPRVPGLTKLELEDYNLGYRAGCRIVEKTDPDISDDVWVDARITSLTKFVAGDLVDDDDPFFHGKRAAYIWALAELKALEPEGEVGLTITAAPPVRGHEVIDFSFITPQMLVQADDDPNSLCVIPRARYNYLLDLERSVSEFTESFTKWEA